MSASESSPLAANLQESIEHLIAETVRRSQSTHEDEQKKLRDVLQGALTEIEAGQAAMSRAASIIQSALETSVTESPSADGEVKDILAENPEPTKVVETVAIPEAVPAPEIGPHSLDVVAHDVSIGIATSLQSMLRDRQEVKSAQTREFVNGELRLHLEMKSGLEMTSFNEWVTAQGGRITSRTASVIELRFGD